MSLLSAARHIATTREGKGGEGEEGGRREGRREGGEEGREGRREGGQEEGREGRREGGQEEGRGGGREGGEGGEGREGEREGRREDKEILIIHIKMIFLWLIKLHGVSITTSTQNKLTQNFFRYVLVEDWNKILKSSFVEMF